MPSTQRIWNHTSNPSAGSESVGSFFLVASRYSTANGRSSAPLFGKSSIRLTLLTTGLLLGKNASQVAELFDDVIVSLDGPERIHDAIRRVDKAFILLQRGVDSVKTAAAVSCHHCPHYRAKSEPRPPSRNTRSCKKLEFERDLVLGSRSNIRSLQSTFGLVGESSERNCSLSGRSSGPRGRNRITHRRKFRGHRLRIRRRIPRETSPHRHAFSRPSRPRPHRVTSLQRTLDFRSG